MKYMNKKQIIEDYMESDIMKEYLTENIAELSNRQLADIIC